MFRTTLPRGASRMVRTGGVMAVAFVLWTGSPALAEDLSPPTAPLRRYYQMEHRLGAERSEALARALVVLSRSQSYERRLELLEQASLADPTWAAPHFERALVALRRHDPATASVAVGDAIRCLRTDAIQEAAFLRGLEQVLHALLLATLATLVVLFLVRTLFFAQHLVDDRPQKVFTTLLIVSAILIGAALKSPLLALFVALLVLLPFLARSERRAMAILCVCLAIVELPLPWMRPHAVLLDPASASAKLARAQRAGGDARLERTLMEQVPEGRERALVLGLLARRRGDLATAERHYVAAITADSEWSTPYVNLANLYFLQGDMQRAAAGYRKAQSLDPENPYAAANLAQTYIRLLLFGEADQELFQASALGYDEITRLRAAWLRGNVPVIDMFLDRGEILHLARDEARTRSHQAAQLLQTWRGDGWAGLSPWQVMAILLALSTALLSRWRLRTVAFECMSCARIVCSHCAPLQRDAHSRVCPFCDLDAPRFDRMAAAEGSSPESEPSRVRRARPPRVVDRLPRWVGTLVPGAAYLACGSPVAALLTALLAWGGLFSAAAIIMAGADRGTPWFVTADAQGLRLAILLVFLAHLIGLLRLRRSWRQLGQALALERR